MIRQDHGWSACRTVRVQDFVNCQISREPLALFLAIPWLPCANNLGMSTPFRAFIHAFWTFHLQTTLFDAEALPFEAEMHPSVGIGSACTQCYYAVRLDIISSSWSG